MFFLNIYFRKSRSENAEHWLIILATIKQYEQCPDYCLLACSLLLLLLFNHSCFGRIEPNLFSGVYNHICFGSIQIARKKVWSLGSAKKLRPHLQRASFFITRVMGGVLCQESSSLAVIVAGNALVGSPILPAARATLTTIRTKNELMTVELGLPAE